MKIRKVLQFLALAAIAAGIFLMRPEKLDRVAPTELEGEIVEATPSPLPIETAAPRAAEAQPEAAMPPSATPAVTIMTREIPGDPGEPPLVPSLALQKGELPWEKRMNDVLDNPKTSDSDKARLLLEMLPTLPVEGRQTATEHAISRLDDRDYRFAQAVLTNPATYPPALAVLWGDLMARPDAISLPTLLQVARNPSHPYAPSARENMDLLLGQDLGTDWPRWETAIREKLAKEPKR